MATALLWAGGAIIIATIILLVKQYEIRVGRSDYRLRGTCRSQPPGNRRTQCHGHRPFCDYFYARLMQGEGV
jgi:hypothetical protein